MDLDEIFQNIESTEVLCLHFPYLRKTLVIDMRSDVEDPPVVRLTAVAKSVEDRFRSIKRMRPRFPQPEKVTIVPWPRYVESLVNLGVWEKVLRRLVDSGHAGVAKQCTEAYEELRRLERAELEAAITGKQYHTIWEAPRS